MEYRTVSDYGDVLLCYGTSLTTPWTIFAVRFFCWRFLFILLAYCQRLC